MSKSTVIHIKEHLDKKDWNKASDLIFNEVQMSVNQRDWQRLSLFNEELLESVLSKKNIKKVVAHTGSLEVFHKQIAELLKHSTVEAEKKPDVEALYFEFQYDGGDDCTGNIFLCTSYSDSHDDWASEFEELVEGMIISEYFSYDPNIDFSPSEHAVASYYVSFCLLKECAEVYFSSHTKYPLGFADHDWGGMIRLTQQ